MNNFMAFIQQFNPFRAYEPSDYQKAMWDEQDLRQEKYTLEKQLECQQLEQEIQELKNKLGTGEQNK